MLCRLFADTHLVGAALSNAFGIKCLWKTDSICHSVNVPIFLKTGFNYSTKQALCLAISGTADHPLRCVPLHTHQLRCFLGALPSPVYAIGGILLNNYETQSLTVAIAAPFGMVGYPMLVAYENLSVGVQYFATFLISTCIFLCGGESMAWLSCNSALDGKRAASFGITLANICKSRNA